jgi:5-methylcytosine-specific restriction endonuclease McrA
MSGDAVLWTRQWKRTRLYVLIRDGYVCQIRGPKCRGYATEVDHIVARVDGGAVFDPSNLRAACQPCNGGRGGRRRYRTAVPDYETRL